MKTPSLTLIATLVLVTGAMAQKMPEPSKVDYKGFHIMTTVVGEYRTKRLVTLDKFNAMSADKDTIILDTRSVRAFKGLHIKGAMHLNFSEFTATKLAKLIPNKNTRILIYCNNNFKDNKRYFEGKSIELALNIPTFINLYGYGYKNIYELSESLSVKDKRLKLDGTSVKRD